MSKKFKIKEEAPAVSIAGGGVPSLTNPTDVYALQLKNRIKKKVLKRKPPKLM